MDRREGKICFLEVVNELYWMWC